MESLYALIKAAPDGYTNERAINELRYVYELARLDPALMPLVESAADALYKRYLSDGAVTNTTLAEMERSLAALSPICKKLRVLLAGHAHIDMNWMWGYPETAAVTLDTFRTVLSLMREYPDFTFSQSQASVYKIVEEYEPAMLDEIRQRVREGRWELTASTWVETDKNMPDGESLARHILLTKRYLSKLFDVDPHSLQIDFEPDTFGHNANVPEILRAGDVAYYYHCRGYDGHNIYRWRSPSGAEVLSYREPVWYNATVTPDAFLHLPAFSHRYGLTTALKVYGVGNHGGGPTRRDIERLRDMQSWPLMPTLVFGTFREFFDTLNARRETFPVVEGELNYVFTGCYTTQSRIKAANRTAEARINEAETLLALDTALTGTPHPADTLQKAWEGLLFNHFHDILPGSGTVDTREYALGQFQRVMASVGTQASIAMRGIADAVDTSAYAEPLDTASISEGAGVGYTVGSLDVDRGLHAFAKAERGNGLTRVYVLFNTTQDARDEVVELTVWDYPDPSRLTAYDADGHRLPCEVIGTNEGYWGHMATRVLVRVNLPGCGYTTIVLKANAPALTIPYALHPRIDSYADDPIVLENDILRTVFQSDTMALTELTDKLRGVTLIDQPSCVFRDILESSVQGMTAWRVGPYMKVGVSNDNPVRVTKVERNSLRQSVTFQTCFRDNTLGVTVTLDASACALRWDITADWFERGSREHGIPQLNFHMPLAFTPDAYRYDIPYGELTRPALRHDVPANSMAAAVHNGAAVFLYADGKYGFRGCDRSISCTLLRASYDPDPYPELGRHHMTLYTGVCAADEIVRIPALLKHPPHAVSTPAHPGTLPLTGSMLTADGVGRIQAIKAGENGGLIVRLAGDAAGVCTLRFCKAPRAACLTDLNETNLAELPVEGTAVRVPVGCGAVVTVHVTL